MRFDESTYKHIAVTCRGSDHLQREQVLQDAVTSVQQDGALFFCLSDGAGSASLSEKGAQSVVDCVVSSLLQYGSRTAVNQEDVLNVLKSARETLAEKACELSVEIGELACTVIAGILTLEFCVAFQIGDGAIVIKKRDAPFYQLMTFPDQGQFQNETFFLTSENWEERLQYCFLTEPIQRFAAFTDGIQFLALKRNPTWTPYEKFFEPFFELLQSKESVETVYHQVKDFLESEKVCSKTGDDKTLIIATCYD